MQKLLTSVKLSILFFFFASPALADFNSAAIAYQNKQYSEALEEFMSMAKIGEVRSQTNLAVMYYYGHGVEQNPNMAYAWARLGSENDKANAHTKDVFNAINDSLPDKQSALEDYKTLAVKFSYETLLKNTFPILLESEEEKSKPDAKPIKTVTPKYPRKALMNSRTGWVTVQFDIDRIGKPRNIRVTDSVPEGVFNKSALSVIPKWIFKPSKDTEGNPIWSYDRKYTINYKFENYEALNKKLYYKIKKNAYAGDAASEYSYGLIHQSLISLDFEKKENPTEWFLKSAQQGLPIAQYQLGNSLVNGYGCSEEKSKGIQWLNRAASNGVDEASELLAKLAIQSPTLESQKQALEYLSQSNNLSAAATIQFAWILSTSPYAEIRNPEKSIAMVDKLSYNEYKDNITKMEIIAASYAALGNFKKAVSIQQDALNDAEDEGIDLVDINSHLELYKLNKTWF